MCVLWVVYVLTVLVEVHVCSMGGICSHCTGGGTSVLWVVYDLTVLVEVHVCSMGGICSHCTGADSTSEKWLHQNQCLRFYTQVAWIKGKHHISK